MAEALALGTLMLHRETLGSGSSGGGGAGSNGGQSVPLGLGLNRGHYDVRLTGQDVERGTFNQRHAVLYDQQTGGQQARAVGAVWTRGRGGWAGAQQGAWGWGLGGAADGRRRPPHPSLQRRPQSLALPS
jgi:hypothetical protein